MRKIATIFIVLALIMCVAVACGKGDGETTTQPIGTQYTPVPQSTTQVNAQSDSGMSYVLTTQPERTVPWAETTRFEITEAGTDITGTTDIYTTAAPGATTDYNIYVNMSEITKPSVVTSNATTAAKTTSAVKTTKADSATVSDNSKPVQLVVNSVAYGNGVIYVEVDPSNWTSGFVSASKSISIKVDGESAGTATCKVPSSKTHDVYEIKIDISSLDIPAGSTVEFTVPTGIVKSKSGTQHNLSYSSSIVAE